MALPKLSLGQIIRITPVEVRDRGMRTCGARIGSVRIEMDEDGVSKVVQARTYCENEYHQTTVRFYHNPEIPSTWDEAQKLLKDIPASADLWNRPVWLGCDCEHFLYNCEVALTKFGCSTVMHSNGAAPIHTNPAFIPWCCKHIVCLAPLAINTNREISREELRPETYPMRPGRPPQALVEMARKKKLTPTEDEVMRALPNVKDFV